MKIGIIGCGNMGGAIARGILSRKVFPFNNIFISDKDSKKTREINRKFGTPIKTNDEIIKKCNFIIVAVKPQDAKKLLKTLSKDIDKKKHLVSIMAGVTIKKIESIIGKKVAVTRAMPNMGALAGKGVTAITHNKAVREKSMVQRIFDSIGTTIDIEERHMDVVTAISGSGPAYFYYLAECMAEAAIKLGIKKDKALKLASETVVGSGAVLDSLGVSPGELRERITSRRGTTEAALRILKSRKLKNIIIKAARAAAKRAKELSRGV